MFSADKWPVIAAGVNAAVDASDRTLLAEAAFAEFYARTSGPVLGYLRRLTGDAATAEDLLQDAYVRLLAAPRLPADDDHRRHYLYRTATNLARDHFRRRTRDTAAKSELLNTQPRSTTESNPDAWVLIRQLSPRDQELLILAYAEGMTHREIAFVTGLVTASIKPLLFRARRRFAAVLAAAGLAKEMR